MIPALIGLLLTGTGVAAEGEAKLPPLVCGNAPIEELPAGTRLSVAPALRENVEFRYLSPGAGRLEPLESFKKVKVEDLGRRKVLWMGGHEVELGCEIGGPKLTGVRPGSELVVEGKAQVIQDSPGVRVIGWTLRDVDGREYKFNCYTEFKKKKGREAPAPDVVRQLLRDTAQLGRLRDHLLRYLPLSVRIETDPVRCAAAGAGRIQAEMLSEKTAPVDAKGSGRGTKEGDARPVAEPRDGGAVPAK